MFEDGTFETSMEYNKMQDPVSDFKKNACLIIPSSLEEFKYSFMYGNVLVFLPVWEPACRTAEILPRQDLVAGDSSP